MAEGRVFEEGFELGDRNFGEIYINPELTESLRPKEPVDFEGNIPFAQTTFLRGAPEELAGGAFTGGFIKGRLPGGGKITLWGRWEPDPHGPNKIGDALIHLADYYKDVSAPLVASSLLLRADTAERFR